MQRFLPRLVPAIVLCLPLAACGGDDDDDESAMTRGDDDTAADDEMAADDDTAAEDEMAADDDTAAEPAADDDAPEDPAGGPNPAPAGPTSADVDELIADVCERGEECTGDPAEDCLAEAAESIGLLAAVCPDLLAPFLECVAESPTCSPEEDCAAEGLALQSCGMAPAGGEPVVDEATIEMACGVAESCGQGDAEDCVAGLSASGNQLELLCPGTFAPYVECVAAMTGCEPEVECADEMMAFEQCGVTG